MSRLFSRASRGSSSVPSPASSGLLPVLALVGAVLLWGGSFSTMKIAVGAFGPMSVMWLRMVIALVLLLPFAKKLWPRGARPGDWKLLAAMSALLPCAYFMFEANALRFTTSAQAGVVSSSVPVLVAVGAALFLGEPLTRRAVAGLVLSVAGVAGLSLAGAPGVAAPAPLLGNMLEFLAMVSAAGSMLLVKKLCGRYGPWTLTALQTLAGSLFFLPGATELPRAMPWDWPAVPALCVLFLGSFVTLGAFGLYNWGMSRLSAGRASAFINLVPLVAVAGGWLWLGEALAPAQAASAALVLCGVIYGQTAPRRGPEKEYADGTSGDEAPRPQESEA
ncbi:protein of unknown function DUF6 transmembrane [Desulfovibrio sp. X2]|uniref:DMT family transporter n=1 Tax=Desulfovibrio sp. X2 TaxID=941449 RepID=UPI000358D784|nr:DMT family transporter [Desulfovibrio sp. X2]EPR44273.1 protein of unknown function DUF6 transmembrane [Desulfovibrio sp. X2]